MVSGFQVDLDPDDLQMGSGVSVGVEEEEEESKEESGFCEERNTSDSAKLVHSGLADLDLDSLDSGDIIRTSKKSLNVTSSSESDIQSQQTSFLGSDADPFSLKQTKTPSNVGGLREKEGNEKVDHLDDWLNSEEGTIVNPYVSTSNMMPEGVALEDSDAEEGKILIASYQ